jgi:hypothetical protein
MIPSWLRDRRRPGGRGNELEQYRRQLTTRTDRIHEVLGDLAESIDALRRRELEVEPALEQLTEAEMELDGLAEELRGILAPQDLHSLHMDYEANLERALRGIVTVERGCGLTRMPHRPPEDEEPLTYWKRGYQNIVHARMRMAELVDVLRTWEPGKVAEATLSARLRREK